MKAEGSKDGGNAGLSPLVQVEAWKASSAHLRGFRGGGGMEVESERGGQR